MVPFKKTALAAILATAAPLALAADQQSGGFDMFLSGGAGYSWFSDTDDVDDWNAELRASVAYTDKSGFGGQMDAVYNRQYLGDVFDYGSSTDFAGHLYYRTNQWLVGGFWQNRSLHLDSGIDPSVDASFDMSMDDQQYYGIEAQGFFGDLTLYGQLGQHKVSFLQDTVDDTGTYASVQARYFLNDNWRVEATYVYDDVEIENYDIGVRQYGVGTEYRLANNPVSVFAQYTRTDYKAYDIDEDRLLVGVKFNFGKDSLRKRDRDGASLNPVPATGLPPLL